MSYGPLLNSAMQGDTETQYILARCVSTDGPLDGILRRWSSYYRSRPRLRAGLHNLGILYFAGLHPVHRDEKKGAEHFLRAVDCKGSRMVYQSCRSWKY